MNKIFVLILFAVFACSVSKAQQKLKYWINFTDKNGNGYLLSRPEDFLSDRAIQRRLNYAIPVHESDLPVNSAYVNQVAGVANTKVLYASRWFNGVVVSFDNEAQASQALAAINGFGFVRSTGKVMRYRLDLMPAQKGGGDDQISQKTTGTSASAAYKYGGSLSQNRQIGVDCLHDRGYRGQGMVIAVMDAGFSSVPANPVFDSLRAGGRLLGTRDFVSGGTNAYVGGDHGTLVLSCMAANYPGRAIGSAPMSSYWLFRTEEGGAETISEEYNWIRAAEFADSVGADILTTSLGYTTFDDPQQNHNYESLNGRTAPMSIAATMAARKGMFVLNAAGNEGEGSWKYISVPSDADSICAVGAADSAGNIAGFSGYGPTSDNRIKPDLSARGAGTWVCQDDAICFPANGTSFATPVLAGAVACYWQKYRDLNNIAVLRYLKEYASNAATPNNRLGWGLPRTCIDLPGESFDFSVYAEAASDKITITLARADYDHVKISIYDLLGRAIVSGDADPKLKVFRFNGLNLSDNIYLVRVETSNGTAVKKFVKQ